ncbi:tyrosine-type recombinase/integrase [Turicibacter sanguinis]|uniref:Tyrosine-type recombinase/integrase n=1 Tax=Turicibacter sanguinis TaxID=154288 RepID=A0A9X5APR7_9FIRM|nr:site-specific integrase [uncultured Turicibacter sp.]MTK22557.1 tyrosine-type recombinase/integrase [Turicibacter sanguinis]MTK72443.1 tyrosine-type recombinase/integrase [Turicibacter sanguinis]
MKGSVRKRGDKWSYYFDIGKTEDGKRKKVERGGFRTKKECEQALRKAIEEYEDKGKVFKDTSWTVLMACNYWYETTQHTVKYNTNRIRRTIINSRIKDQIGHIYLSKLSPAILQNFFNEIAPNRSAGYLNDIYTVLNQTFDLAVKQGHMKQNIMTQIIKPKKRKPGLLTKALTDEEIIKLLTHIKKNAEDYYLPVLFGLHNGTRIGETFALTWDDVDLENKTVSITKNLITTRKHLGGISEYRIDTTKTNAGNRKTYLTQIICDELSEWKIRQKENQKKYGIHYHQNDLDYIFTRENGELIKFESLQTFLQRSQAKLGFKVNYHRLRHTHITTLFEVGATIREVQSRVGQSDIRTTLEIYTHVTEQMQNKTAAALEKRIINLPPN